MSPIESFPGDAPKGSSDGFEVEKTSPNIALWTSMIVLVVAFLFLPIRLKITFRHDHQHQFIGIGVSIGGSPFVTIPWTIRRRTESRRKKNGAGSGLKRLLNRIAVNRSIAILQKFLSARPPLLLRHIERFQWETRIGTGDAAATGWIVGSLWSAKATLFAIFSRYVDVTSPPRLHISPDFDQPILNTEVNCIFLFKFGEVMYALINEGDDCPYAKGTTSD